MKILLNNATVITGERTLFNHSVLIKGSKISKIAPEIKTKDKDVVKFDLHGDYVVPGFIDVQVNGGGGEFFTKDITEEAVDKIFEAHLEHGTTSLLPTIISTTHERILESISVTKKIMSHSGIIGMHLEGPYFNPQKKGAHFEEFIHVPSDEEIQDIIKNGKGVIKVLTLAPEMVADKHIKQLVEAGIKVSAGHSNATYEEAKKAFDLGVTKVTHLFNAMSQFNSRTPGLVGAYFNSDIWGAIIVDGVHVDLGSVRIAHKLANGRLFLVSDASFVQESLESFEFDGFQLKNVDGNYYTEDGSLAGSSICLYDAFKICVEQLHIPMLEAVRMSSTYPAQFLGMEDKIGLIKEGLEADIVILDKSLKIKQVLKSGALQKSLN
jgi:N-acetylglucosamine-6-phosphate deacetylase